MTRCKHLHWDAAPSTSGLDSVIFRKMPAEAALTWVVRALCPYEVSTQYELSTADRRFFADIAIPHCKLIIEFDGSRNWDQHKENSTARNARGFNANRCCKIRAGISSESTGLISTIGMHCAVGLAMRSG